MPIIGTVVPSVKSPFMRLDVPWEVRLAKLRLSAINATPPPGTGPFSLAGKTSAAGILAPEVAKIP